MNQPCTLGALREVKLGNDVSTVEDVVQALEFLGRQGQYAEAPRPDLILLDLDLARKDGRELLAEIKNDESVKSIPVVVLADSDGGGESLRAQQGRANACISKPVAAARFLEVVRSIGPFCLVVVTSGSQPSGRERPQMAG